MKRDRYFIYTGNAYPHKNLKRLIEAVAHLNTKVDQKIKLKIVSSRNEFTQRLQEYIKYSNAASYLELLGYVNDKELVRLYAGSIAFVFPSLSEGFGLPGIEAMRAGTLVMASDIDIFKEVYGVNAIYFNPLDPTSIEKTMRRVIEMKDEEKNKQIAAAKKFVKRYSWRKMAEETLKIYDEVLK